MFRTLLLAAAVLAATLAPTGPEARPRTHKASPPKAAAAGYAAPWMRLGWSGLSRDDYLPSVELACQALSKGGYGNCRTVSGPAAAAPFARRLLADPVRFKPPLALRRPGLKVRAQVAFAWDIHGALWAQASIVPEGGRFPDSPAMPEVLPPPLPAAGPPPVEPRRPPGPQPMPPPPPAPTPNGGWLEKPTPEQLVAVYPERAARLEQAGVVVVACIVADDGRLRDCTVVREDPEGFGFGEAALKVTPYFRVAPVIDGAPMAGRTIRFPINFRLE